MQNNIVPLTGVTGGVDTLPVVHIQPEEFLSAFFAPDETVCLRIFDDKKRGAFKGAKLECKVGKIIGSMDMLREHNDQGRGVFFVINYGGHEDADITRINAQFVECDELPITEQYTQISAFALAPSIIVRTAKSLHCYWLMKDAKLSDFRRVQKKLIAQFHGDPACVNESRVFRLPGFNHCKGDLVPVVCVKYNPELRYTQAELEAALPNVPEEAGQQRGNASVSLTASKGLPLVTRRCAFIQHCRDNAAVLCEHDWYAMISNLAVFEGGDKAIHELSSGYPGYNHDETQEKIKHFLASQTKPMTCSRIAEAGFQCPRMLDGSCDCKSPAALCFKPLDLRLLREMLEELPVTNSVSEDMQTAHAFTCDYLYNVDAVLATSFIDNELRGHFGFKNTAMRPLHTMYRELAKEHRSKRERDKNAHIDDLPPWYEPTEHGLRFLPNILATHMAEHVNAFYAAGSYYAYEKGVYEPQDSLWARKTTLSFMLPDHATMNTIKDACWQWNALIKKPVEDINPNPYIINVRNGLYNVLEDTLEEHTPTYLSTIQLNARYDSDATCPRFEQFLHEALSEDDIPLVQEVFGYCLVPINRAQKSFVLVGEPGAGKSKLLLTLNQILLGQKNVSNIPWQNLSDRFNKAELFGKLANIFADLPTKNIYDNGVFKALVGEDYVNAERKGKDPFSFQPTARLLFSCNSIPRNYGDKSEGFYRRLIVIRFSKSMPPEHRDPMLLERFAAEADGILMFAIGGLKRLIARDFQFSESEKSRSELDQYRIDSNSALSFIADMCELNPDAEVERSEFYARYREYCKTAGLVPYSQKAFHRDLENNYPTLRRATDRLGKRRTWRGIQVVEGGVT